MSRTVVITGASSGIGRATALRFAREGARIGLIAREEGPLASTQADVRATGGDAIYLPLDVADEKAVERAADAVEKAYGEIDVWINAAAVSMYAPVMETRSEEYRRIMDVGFLGQVHGVQAALHRMLPRDRGHIVLVGSGLGYRGIPLQSAYCAMKAALRGFAESLQTELQHDGSHVTVTYLAPSAVNTPFYHWARCTLPHRPNALRPVYEPELIADAIRWTVDHPRRELAVGSPAAWARQGGLTAAGLIDRVLGRVGVTLQQTEDPNDPDDPGNLWRSCPGHGVRGDFPARGRSWNLLVSQNRAPLLVAGAILAGLWSLRRR